MICRGRSTRIVLFIKVFILEIWVVKPLEAFRPLLAEMRQGVAQRSAGELHQSLERRVHLQDQEDRT
jgi:hypothetical protein